MFRINDVLLMGLTTGFCMAAMGCGKDGGSLRDAAADANLGDMVGGGGLGDTIGGDEHSGEPAKGRFSVSSTWDLSAPLGARHTLGDVFTDVLVSQLASTIPSDGAVERIDDLVRPTIKAQVDALAPEALRPDSPLMEDLARSLAQVELVSELTLEDGGLTNDLKGTERVMVLRFDNGQEVIQATPDEIFSTDMAHIESTWKAQANGDGQSLDVAGHRVEIRFGQLVQWVLENALEQDGAALVRQNLQVLECDSIVDGLLGEHSELGFEVGGQRYGMERPEIVEACQRAKEALGDRALGLFALDTRVEVGGTVLMVDEDGDGQAEALTHGPDFGGFVAVAPRAIAPRLTVRFEATRID